MPTWIGLLRGIGGNIRTLPMKDLVAALEGLGLEDVRTYIQTGNFVFTSRKAASALVKQIDACTRAKFGFESATFVLSVAELERAIAANPFPQADKVPTSLHLFFLARPAKSPQLDAMNALKAPSEQFKLAKQVFYFYAPQGFGISKLGRRAERLLGVEATARNWRTVRNLLALAKGG
ncbi:MAG: DUF1697 domain-containing protein [Steroidobacteraceae bacterium]